MNKDITTAWVRDHKSDIIGLTIAEAAAKYPTHTFRAVAIDGKPQIVTMDLRSNRINVILVNGHISAVKGIY